MRHVYRWAAARLLAPGESVASALANAIATNPGFGISEHPSDWVFFATPLDEPAAWAAPRVDVGSSFRLESGAEDAWQAPVDYWLSGIIRWIDPVVGAFAPEWATPWFPTAERPVGVETLIRAAAAGQALLWVPDSRSRPLTGQKAHLMVGQPQVTLEPDLTMSVPITLRSDLPFELY